MANMPHLDPELVNDFVNSAHGDLDKVTALVVSSQHAPDVTQEQIRSLRAELDNLRDLAELGYVTRTRILALQRESDTGTYHFGANLGVSIRQAGRIIVDLIPHYYDTKRVVRILGEDGEVQTAMLVPDLEVPFQMTKGGALFNPSMGKYDVSITVGPSYNTKRMEAAAIFTEMAKGAADPVSASVLRYLVLRNSDASASDEGVKMLRALIPPQVLQAVQGNQQLPPMAQAMLVQAQQAVQVLQQELQVVEIARRQVGGALVAPVGRERGADDVADAGEPEVGAVHLDGFVDAQVERDVLRLVPVAEKVQIARLQDFPVLAPIVTRRDAVEEVVPGGNNRRGVRALSHRRVGGGVRNHCQAQRRNSQARDGPPQDEVRTSNGDVRMVHGWFIHGCPCSRSVATASVSGTLSTNSTCPIRVGSTNRSCPARDFLSSRIRFRTSLEESAAGSFSLVGR